MLKHKVRTAEQALAYLTDCTLATVCMMAMKKSRPKGEYARQISIAQCGVDWMREFGVVDPGNRAADVLAMGGSVADWAKQFMEEENA